ncbi:MAG: T9SS type A sorting domain-containing protein [Cyclobacteriaceae bacterium]|jgi:hypothetical protein|nr:T9SS type A sorting domain-containing protein [Cyclobacteriaceae bacterium]
MKKSLLCLIISGIVLFNIETGYTQKVMWQRAKGGTICYGKMEDHNFVIPPPEIYEQSKKARTKTANFNVTYIGFSAEAQAAFQRAVDIWETLLVSPVTINVTANWAPLGSGVLGSATAGTFHANFDGAQQLNVFYPAPLAEKMAGKELNDPTDPDIFASFNSANSAWSFSLDQNVSTPGRYSLVTVVLHELGHGLGFLDSYTVTGNNGVVGLQSTGVPVPYDLALENNAGTNLFVGFTSPSAALRDQLISNNLFYRSPAVVQNNGNAPGRVFAPTTFSNGSSIAHWDESTFNGTPNALMTPQVAPNERIFDPGELTLSMFRDMGWEFVYINHQRLTDTENTTGPYLIEATFQADKAPISAPTVVYNNGGSNQELPMILDVNSGTYKATIPSTGIASTYQYFIRVNDNSSRTFTEPGKLTRVTTGTVQNSFQFKTGTDIIKPKIVHSPKAFLIDAETDLEIEAQVSDNAKLSTVKLEYFLNDVAQPTIDLILQNPQEDSIYQATINIASLTDGQKLKYRIVATDNAANSNIGLSPATGYYEINTVGLLPAVDQYINDFNSNVQDYFTEGFTISTPAGFSNGGIHSEHPYVDGEGFPNNERELIYQIRVPVTIKSNDATLRFDEIVLVEPGAVGSVFGDNNFYDYVIVEGSKDGGLTWTALGPGYDSRDKTIWLNKYNSATSGNNSTAVGDPTLFQTRTYDLLTKFNAGDQVIFRFRMYIDEVAHGWGWAIDNLKIQIDDTPPTILHQHLDWIPSGNSGLTLSAIPQDVNQVTSLKLFYKKSNGTAAGYESGELSYTGVLNNQTLTFDLDFNNLQNGDSVSYYFLPRDNSNNLGQILEYVARVGTLETISTYNNNFNAPSITSDFSGNFFSLSQPSGFANLSLQTSHPYPNGFGLDGSSDFTLTLLKKIDINEDNPYINFNEIAIINANDYVVVEASKDDGQTWVALTEQYNASKETVWTQALNANANGSSSMFRRRVVKLTKEGEITSTDNVIIRFRLRSNQTGNAWGWAIDDLGIQDITTESPSLLQNELLIGPNPFNQSLSVQFTHATEPLEFTITNLNGANLHQQKFTEQELRNRTDLNPGDIQPGIYILKISNGKETVYRKLIKQ